MVKSYQWIGKTYFEDFNESKENRMLTYKARIDGIPAYRVHPENFQCPKAAEVWVREKMFTFMRDHKLTMVSVKTRSGDILVYRSIVKGNTLYQWSVPGHKRLYQSIDRDMAVMEVAHIITMGVHHLTGGLKRYKPKETVKPVEDRGWTALDHDWVNACNDVA